ncbi:MAG: epoxyqueuosine reductase QueH [Lachnospiraceae bacterium]|nr:epoxyqueuosine reductase QueH [Lachnospiraceae bacterium]
MNQRNFQKELDKLLECLPKDGEAPQKLFLHSCCAPCSSYVLEYLSPHFQITVFYYNPNITASAEYFKRVEEQKRLIKELNTKEGHYPIQVVEGDYRPEVFLERSKGLEDCPEGGERCFACYALRLEETAKRAKEAGADYYATTLTISPLKNAGKLNEIGEEMAKQYGVPWLPSDFKKKNGYKRSIELSAEYDLYRQDYCGCAFSKAERERQKAEEGNC